jgi:hypothetical protein
MDGRKLAMMGTILGVALSLVPAAARAERLTREEAIEGCVRLRERAVPCKEVYIDAMIDLRAKHQPRIAKMIQKLGREKVREIGLRETVEDGAGPLEERRRKCAKTVRGLPPREAVAPIEACIAKTECGEFVKCVMPELEKLMFGKR